MKSILFIAVLLLSYVLPAQNKLSSKAMLAVADSNQMLMPDGRCRALILVDAAKVSDNILPSDLSVYSKAGTIWSVAFPYYRIDYLLKQSWLLYMEPAHCGEGLRKKNDTERALTGVDKVQNGATNGLKLDYKGKGVVVGIVDVGFQCNHPTFYNADGSATRITRYWEQFNKNGPAPQGFAYGTEFKDSTTILQGNDRDGIHGTHVAGIAAGSGLTTPSLQYRGMAPEAELVFVSIKYSNDTLGGSALGDYIIANPNIIDAYAYIFNYAQSVGKPAVINLSWGMHTGPHDGSSLFDQATVQLTGKGKILVGSNGNEGDNPMHWNHHFNGDTAAVFMIENTRKDRKTESIYTDFWGSPNSSFKARLKILDTNHVVKAITPFVSTQTNTIAQYTYNADTGVFKFSFSCNNKSALNSKPNMTITASQPNTRKYAVVLEMVSDTAMVHGWNSGGIREWTGGSFQDKVGKLDYSGKFIKGNTDYTCGENGGTSTAVISVGAMAARSSFKNILNKTVNDSGYAWPGQIAKFSSKGPTVDGRIKPDISAPGFDVPSAVNNAELPPWMHDKALYKSAFRGDTCYWVALSGTSMASPHVAGIVALMLQANPDLTAAEARFIIQQTASANDYTGSLPNNVYGYGIINAFEAVKAAQATASVNSLNTGNAVMIYPNPASDIVYVTVPRSMHYKIMAVDGKILDENTIASASGKAGIDVSALATGYYILNIKFEGQFYAFKFLKG